MAVRGFFYNSVNKDRMYNGKDMNEDKAPFYKEGVCAGQMQVTADGGSMVIKVDGGEKTGYGYLNLHTIHNTTVLRLTINQANGTLPRIDRVVMRNDETERKPGIFVLKGYYSNNPQPRELTNNDTIQEKCLAEVYVATGAVEITQANITDTRADTTLCGFIASQFEDVDFSQFQKQFDSWLNQEKKSIEDDHEAFTVKYEDLTQSFMDKQEKKWDAWFAAKQTELSGDVAGNLQLQISDLITKVRDLAFKVYITVVIPDESGKGFSIIVTLTNITTGAVQKKDVSENGMGFYITEPGTYTLKSDLRDVMPNPKRFDVSNDRLMTTLNVALRESARLGYIENYTGSYIVK